MKITCISTSNTKNLGEKSTSTKVCHLIKETIENAHHEAVSVEVVPLMDYDLDACILCGECFKDSKCIYDESFNQLFSKLVESDAIFFVVPHYACIPSKLTMIFEKMNEILYVNWYNNELYKFPLTSKPVGIIAHGGSSESENVLKYYKAEILDHVANTLQSFSLDVIGVDEQWTNGVAFGLKNYDCIKRVPGELLPSIEQDWEKIRLRIAPLVDKVMEKAASL